MFKPVLPYVSDFIGHVFFYAHHMATVHYEDGKYHVHYETAKDAKEDTSDKTSPSSKKDNAANEHIIAVLKQPVIFVAKATTKYPVTFAAATINGEAANNYPPPRC